MGENPLGKPANYSFNYDPGLLHAVPRRDARVASGIEEPLPFTGVDIWNAWELSWLDQAGKPLVATATLRVPADSPNIIESKSLKLYLGSFAMTRVSTVGELQQRLVDDLSKVAGHAVAVEISTYIDGGKLTSLPGHCIDNEPYEPADSVDATLLRTTGTDSVSEELHSHLLYSLCPVTGQPDTGSILVRYRGSRIEPASLLRYIVAYRGHQDFHEACVERIFVDLKQSCAPEQLTVMARYNRRGGIDINPYRSDFETDFENLRLRRQ